MRTTLLLACGFHALLCVFVVVFVFSLVSDGGVVLSRLVFIPCLFPGPSYSLGMLDGIVRPSV